MERTVMRYKEFLDVGRTQVQAYFKEGVELIYPDQCHELKLVILPAYDPQDPSATGFLPAVSGEEEAAFYAVVRAAKFVGHGNRRAKTSFLSPKTFDIYADDPYDAFYDYCSRSDKWSYLTKDGRKRLSGEVEGAVFPRVKNFFCANVYDATNPRGGVYVTELSESVMKGILYKVQKNGSRIDGLAFQKDDDGNLVYGDITNPEDALVIEVSWGGKGYAARAARCSDGSVWRTKIPEVLLQHRFHMESPETFISRPNDGQEIVDRIACLLRGYKHPDDTGLDEITALKEAMKFAYGDRYYVPEDDEIKENDSRTVIDDPFGDAAKDAVSEEPRKKAEEVLASVDRGVEREKYTPVGSGEPRPIKKKKKSARETGDRERSDIKEHSPSPFAPGENVDLSDIAAMRAMLSGGK